MGSTITIDFHGDPLAVIINEAGTLVPLRPLVIGMGLDWSGQLQRVRRNPILGPAVVMIPTTESPAGDKDGICLPLDLVPGFLFTIDASRVTEAVKPKVLDYQRECFRVLADACLGKPAHVAPVSAEILPAPIDGLPTPVAVRLITEARMTFGTMAARELWFTTGLPIVPAMRMPPRQGDLFQYSRGA